MPYGSVRPRMQAKRTVFICLYLPDDTTGFVRTSQPLGDRADIATGNLEFRCREPFDVWEVRYDGPIHHFLERASHENVRRTLSKDTATRRLRLDLEFRAKHEPFDYDKRRVSLRPAPRPRPKHGFAWLASKAARCVADVARASIHDGRPPLRAVRCRARYDCHRRKPRARRGLGST